MLLQRLVGNLLSNALRNTHRGGVLMACAGSGGVPHRDLGHRRGHRRGAPAGDLPGVLPDSLAGGRKGFWAWG